MKLEPWLREILACPQCHAPLRDDEEAAELVCTGSGCGLAYPVRDGIPVLLIDEARGPDQAAHRPDQAPQPDEARRPPDRAPSGPAGAAGPESAQGEARS